MRLSPTTDPSALPAGPLGPLPCRQQRVRFAALLLRALPSRAIRSHLCCCPPDHGRLIVTEFEEGGAQVAALVLLQAWGTQQL